MWKEADPSVPYRPLPHCKHRVFTPQDSSQPTQWSDYEFTASLIDQPQDAKDITTSLLITVWSMLFPAVKGKICPKIAYNQVWNFNL